MYGGKYKKFKDTIHGYIEIPEILVKEIIDTELFQRLRYIEQTSMRPLYPAARHDRFIHSLGVYWLGVRAFEYFEKNARKELKLEKLEVNDLWWEKQKFLFSCASLLHDCAHAPFSHTLEKLYEIRHADNNGKRKKTGRFAEFPETRIKIDYKLLSRFKGHDGFHNDFFKNMSNKGEGAPHEKMSAYLAVTDFKAGIAKAAKELIASERINEDDYEFIARMITGCLYGRVDDYQVSLKNCIISMLNSSSIDIDGLDYIVRDSYMSGIDNFSVDYQRLLSSFTIIPVEKYEEVEIENADLKGIWLADSEFKLKRVTNATITGNLIGNGFKKNIDSWKPDGQENLSKDRGTFITGTNGEVSIPDAMDVEITLKESCRILQGKYSGIIRSGEKIHNRGGRRSGKKIYSLHYILGFGKNSLSIMQSTLDARNHEYLWVYTHPKVLYCSEYLQLQMLNLSGRYLCCTKNNKNNKVAKYDFSKCRDCTYRKEPVEDFILYILGFESFFTGEPDETIKSLKQKGYLFCRTNDDDLNALYKRIMYENRARGELRSDEIERIFSAYFMRKHQKTLWKSFAEYDIFKNKFGVKANSLFRICDRATSPNSIYREEYGFLPLDEQKIFEKYGMKNVVIVKSSVKTKQLNSRNTYIDFGGEVHRLYDVLDKSILKDNLVKEIYYIFADTDAFPKDRTMEKFLDELSDLGKTEKK